MRIIIPKNTDASNRTVKGIKLFQKLLAFHKDDKDNSAFLDADLHRLRFGHNSPCVRTFDPGGSRVIVLAADVPGISGGGRHAVGPPLPAPLATVATVRAAFTMWAAAPCFNPSDHIAGTQPKPGCRRSEFSISNDRTLWQP